MGTTHELKTDPAVFTAVLSGAKTHEIRKNDRAFAVGDELLLRETVHTGAEIAAGAPLEYTGRTTTRTVSHVLTGYGLLPGWCILSIATPQHPDLDADVEELALKHIARSWHSQPVALYRTGEYKKTEQFRRLKAFAVDLLSRRALPEQVVAWMEPDEIEGLIKAASEDVPTRHYGRVYARQYDADMVAVAALAIPASTAAPVDMILHSPACHMQHIDTPDERTPGWNNEPHRSHLCHGCNHIWRPADAPTNGVKAISTSGKNDSLPATTAADHNSQDPACSCPSGNGSLRWPCPVHPPESATAADQQGDTASEYTYLSLQSNSFADWDQHIFDASGGAQSINDLHFRIGDQEWKGSLREVMAALRGAAHAQAGGLKSCGCLPAQRRKCDVCAGYGRAAMTAPATTGADNV